MNILLSGSLKSFLQLIGVLLIFIAVLAVTYLTTRWMGQYQKGKNLNKNLRLVETIAVGNNTFVSILEAGKRYFVVAIAKEKTTLIAELTKEELKDLSFLEGRNAGRASQNFAEIFDKMKDKLPTNKN